MDIRSLISTELSSYPVSVLIWIHPEADENNVQRILPLLYHAIHRWEEVATCRLSFTTRIVREGGLLSSSPPFRRPEELLVVIANETTEGESGFVVNFTGGAPANGYPGFLQGIPANQDWSAAVARGYSDSIIHEFGHALGFWHSPLGIELSPAALPKMNWVANDTTDGKLTLDDVVAATTAYPVTTPGALTILRGICVKEPGGKPVSGIHVVVYKLGSTREVPVASRVTGPRVRGPFGQKPGEFEFKGLPPGNYRLRFLDGNSISKNHDSLPLECLGLESVNSSFEYIATSGFQNDNFSTLPPAMDVTIKAGAALSLDPVPVSILPITVNQYHLGTSILDGNGLRETFITLPSNDLPRPQLNVPYEIWLPIRGGVRPVSIVSTVPAPDVHIALRTDPRPMTQATYGKEYLHISGTFATTLVRVIDITLEDAHGLRLSLRYSLRPL